MSYQPSRQELERQIAVLREYVHALADHGDAVAVRVLAAARSKAVHHICCACAGTGVNAAIDHADHPHDPHWLQRGGVTWP